MYTGGLLSHVFRATGTNGHPPLPPVVLQSSVPLSLCVCVGVGVLTDEGVSDHRPTGGRLDAISKAVSQTFGAGVEFVMAA